MQFTPVSTIDLICCKNIIKINMCWEQDNPHSFPSPIIANGLQFAMAETAELIVIRLVYCHVTNVQHKTRHSKIYFIICEKSEKQRSIIK